LFQGLVGILEQEINLIRWLFIRVIDLKDEIARRAAAGERFFRMDIKPPFSDTPPDWEDRLEAVFTAVR